MKIKGTAVVSRVKQQKKYEIITLRLNSEEFANLQQYKMILKQPKDGTAIKQMMAIAANVIHDEKITDFVNIILGNKRKNKRLGIVEYE